MYPDVEDLLEEFEKFQPPMVSTPETRAAVQSILPEPEESTAVVEEVLQETTVAEEEVASDMVAEENVELPRTPRYLPSQASSTISFQVVEDTERSLSPILSLQKRVRPEVSLKIDTLSQCVSVTDKLVEKISLYKRQCEEISKKVDTARATVNEKAAIVNWKSLEVKNIEVARQNLLELLRQHDEALATKRSELSKDVQVHEAAVARLQEFEEEEAKLKPALDQIKRKFEGL